jgi:hypothetical protein
MKAVREVYYHWNSKIFTTWLLDTCLYVVSKTILAAKPKKLPLSESQNRPRVDSKIKVVKMSS